MERIKLIVPGKPVPLSRTGHGQFGGKFFAAPTSKQIGLVVGAWEGAGSPRLEDDLALLLIVLFRFERPKSHFGTGRNAGVLKPWAEAAAPTARPDLSNLVKLVEDALNGNAFRDDSRIVAIRAAKIYGERARTTIELQPA